MKAIEQVITSEAEVTESKEGQEVDCHNKS